MTAHQEQDQAVVSVLAGSLFRRGHELRRGRTDHDPLRAPAPRVFAADSIDQAPGGHRGQPRPRVVRNASGRLLAGGFDQTVLDGVLAQIEGKVAADERAEDLGGKTPQLLLDALIATHLSGPDSCRMGQTSTAGCRRTSR